MPERLRSLPLFPLELVLYPGARQPLHIFEDRYKELVADCLGDGEEGQPFGIVLAEDGVLRDVGTTAEIEKVVERYEDGRIDLIGVGGERFRTEDVHSGERAYLTADVELLPDDDPEAEVPPEVRERAITQHMKLLELAGHTPRPDLYEDARERLAFVLAQNAALETAQKQEVLELRSERKRLDFLVEHLEELLPRVEQKQSTRERIRSNGHFKDFPIDD
jgi:ATP-dependent Lon protease